jgi:hypothetical protein
MKAVEHEDLFGLFHHLLHRFQLLVKYTIRLCLSGERHGHIIDLVVRGAADCKNHSLPICGSRMSVVPFAPVS